MNSIKKTTQKTSGTHKRYKPGQLLTINRKVYRIIKNTDIMCCCSLHCDLYSRKMGPCVPGFQCAKWVPFNCYLKLIKKHKG